MSHMVAHTSHRSQRDDGDVEIVVQGIPCFGGRHRLAWNGDGFVRIDHLDVGDAELALHTLAGEVDVCRQVLERVDLGDPTWAVEVLIDADRFAVACAGVAEAAASYVAFTGIPVEQRTAWITDGWAQAAIVGMPTERRTEWAERHLAAFCAAWSAGGRRPQGATEIQRRLKVWAMREHEVGRRRRRDRELLVVHLDAPGTAPAAWTQRLDATMHVHLPADGIAAAVSTTGLPSERNRMPKQ